ncbi:Uncharacterised protein [Candidatus Tiddalikarchaeum anstoanum]|nr:Uncharacterised protein [Candidatus Tiddalikarchaeum anstoanum]
MDVEEFYKNCDWKNFEKLVCDILELHNYTSFHNVNLTINHERRQFDVLGMKNNTCLAIDCKKWDNKKSRSAKLKEAVLTQKNRCKILKSLLGKKVLPLIVTFSEDSIIEYEGVNIVPLRALNDYILNLF